MRRRILLFGLAALFVFGLAACGDQGESPPAAPAATAPPTRPAQTSPVATAPATIAPASPVGTEATEIPVGTAPPATVAAQDTKPPAATAYDKLLTPADVEQVSGLKGVKLVAYDPSKGAGGDLNFATAEGKLVLIANFFPASVYDATKKQKGVMQDEISGLGDDAYDGPGDPGLQLTTHDGPVGPSMIAFRKGSQSATLAGFMNVSDWNDWKLYLSLDQVEELAKLVASRM